MGRGSAKQEAWFDDAKQAVATLKQGGILLHATDTVWGLACDATSNDAVERLNALKMRHPVHPVLTLMADDGMLQRHVPYIPEVAWQLMDESDRPTTIVYPEGRNVSTQLLGSNGSLAVRRVEDPYCVFVIRGLGKPIASTSANLTGQPTPSCFREVPQALIDGADHVSMHRQQEAPGNATPSMMVAFDEQERFTLIRR